MLAELYCFQLVRLSVRGHSNSVIFNRISSKFHIWIALIILSFKFEYRSCLTSDNQDGRQHGRHLSISAVVVTLTQSFLIGFLPNFEYGLFQSTSPSSSNTGFVQHPITKMADNMATIYQYPLCRGHSNSVIFNQISSKFHLWIASIILSIKLEYVFNQDGRQNGHHLSISAVVVTLAQSFLIRFLPNFIYGLLPSTFFQVRIWVLFDIQ